MNRKEELKSTTEEKSRKTKWIIFTLAIGILLTVLIRKSYSSILENDVKVKANSDLTYYLDISYDGVDKNGIKSDNNTVSEIKSGVIFVEDKLPEGLIFNGFVTTDDGSIGAVKRSDRSSCTGKVVDDSNESASSTGSWNEEHTEFSYHGLHYNENTRTVSFQVKNLKAGCILTVGIKTKTPKVQDPTTPEKEVRRDFYNFATAREKGLTINSNTVHTFIGSELVSLYNVRYEYTGILPDEVPNPPQTASYVAGAKVGVAANVNIEGYIFSGWQTTDVEIENSSFRMPANDITLTGSFTRNVTKKVTYSINGVSPAGYELPLEKEYYPGAVVEVDLLKAGDIMNGYRFTGWTSENIEISEDGDFIMPEEDVTLVGEFREVSYKVVYQFYDSILPPNSQNYLPEIKYYHPGEVVTLESVTEPSGYKFLGWYKENEFKMPDEDIIIYGEWKEQTGTFEPEITREIINKKDYYRVGDVVELKVTVTNTASFPIHSIIVKENTKNFSYKSGQGYTVVSDHVASIDTISANAKVELYATYTVKLDDKGTIENETELKGALSDNNYELLDKEYKASVSFKIQSKLKICNTVTSRYNDNVFQFLITGEENHYETWMTLEKDECETIFIDPATYQIKEIIPQEYVLKSVGGAITENDSELVVEEGHDYEIIYTNEFVKKGFLHSFGRVISKIEGGE